MKKYQLYPEIEPYITGTLKVSGIHTLFYEEAGNKDGRPVIFLHGGPGVGILPGYRRFFDPAFYRIILLDQRGSGRSTPDAELKENTTDEIVEDLERLKKHLGVDRWLVFGGSWGSLLALCYGISHPDSVRGIIIRGVFLGRRSEIEWLHGKGASRIFPDQWEKYLSVLPESEREHPVTAYYKIFNSADRATQLKAARAWSAWEAYTMNLIPDPKAIEEMTSDEAALSIGRIECHFTYNNFFLESDNYILENIGKLHNIPCRIVQGRYDVICPVKSAWELHKALPGSELVIVPAAGHSPFDGDMVHELVRATEEYKRLFQ
jgi:proline iminopeptidase